MRFVADGQLDSILVHAHVIMRQEHQVGVG